MPTNIPQNVCSTSTKQTESPANQLLHYFSCWNKLLAAVAVYLKLKELLQERIRMKRNLQSERLGVSKILSVGDLANAEIAILRWLHGNFFSEEIKVLEAKAVDKTRSRGTTDSKSSSIYKLDPYLKDGILRVGGRVSKAHLSDETKHPIILPKKSHITSHIT